MAVFNGERFVFEIETNSPLKQIRVNAEQRKTLNHYTSVESLLKICDTKTLKMNSIKSLNDKEEASYISVDSVEDLVFISSFCNGNESIPLWHMYTEPKYGVNISFNFPNSQESFSKVIFDDTRAIQAKVSSTNTYNQYNRIASKIVTSGCTDWWVSLFESDVKYDDNGIKDYPVFFNNEDGGRLYNLTSLGIVKHSAWNYENETRLVGHFRTTKEEAEMPNLDFILIPITFSKLDSITITFSPWMSAEFKEVIQKYINDKVTECRVEYRDSVFKGIIERKF